MKGIYLVHVVLLCYWTSAQEQTYLITAPKTLRLDATETVLVQLFGYNQESTVTVSLKSSMASGHRQYASESVTLNAQNEFQRTVSLRIFAKDFPSDGTHVYLHAYMPGAFNQHVKIPVSRDNGFLFIQTDKPLYTPDQSVKVRVFSLSAELKKAGRPVTLTFKDPDEEKIDIVEMNDVSGILSMQNPFKIPLKPKLGVWKIEASYSDTFSTEARAQFEVKEYVLPSISIVMQPEANYVSGANFESFKLDITARYVSGIPVGEAVVYVNFGYIAGENVVMIPETLKRHNMAEGKLEVILNIKDALNKMADSGPRELREMEGNLLHVVTLVKEATGGISQQAELSSVKFVRSPFTLGLVATPTFIKPGLPYTIRVLVKDPLGKPVFELAVRLVRASATVKGQTEKLSTTSLAETQITTKDGIALFIFNIPIDSESAFFSFETADEQQLSTKLEFTAKAYKSINQRYLYINLPSQLSTLQVGQYASIDIHFAYRVYLNLKAFSYQVISKGRTVKYATVQRIGNTYQNINFKVTHDMVPSARLLVYYILSGESSAELVADSVWIDVKDNCVNGLKLDLSIPAQDYRPKDGLKLDVNSEQQALVALSAVDTALYSLGANHQDPLTRVLQHIERSDRGCGGGGGKDNADVFRLAGLTFLTNANAQATQPEDETCTAIVRPKRSTKKLTIKPEFRDCCRHGAKNIPTLYTCAQKAEHLNKNTKKLEECKEAFIACCLYKKNLLTSANESIHARAEIEWLFDTDTFQVRSFFPESWLWEVQPLDSSGKRTFLRTLPDSLTTWEIKAVAMFTNGICVADPVKVPVTQRVSLDVPLPYSMVRGEQIELQGSVYNQHDTTIKYCVTLSAGPEVCLFQGQLSRARPTKSTACHQKPLQGESVALVSFTLLALEVGTHTLTFTLRTDVFSEVLVKTLRVVPEGIKTVELKGGLLDPRAVYGSSRRKIEIINSLPPHVVPRSSVERHLTFSGELLGEVLAIFSNPEGLQKLLDLPAGSAEEQLMRLLQVYYVYHYLHSNERWDVMGQDSASKSRELRNKMREAIISISSFKKKDKSYSMWGNRDFRESSTWLTALVVKALAEASKYVKVDVDELKNSVFWLIHQQDANDNSFRDNANYKPVTLMGAGSSVAEQSVYLTSFVIIAIKKAMAVPECNLQEYEEALGRATDYLSKKVRSLKSMYVRAIAVYALTHMDQNSRAAVELYTNLMKDASVTQGNPPVKFWQEKGADVNPLKPNKASAQTVETTAYVLLTNLLKGNVEQATPILGWLTQDQRYGGGFLSTQDTILTLDALTEYSLKVKHGVLNLEIRTSYKKKGELQMVVLNQKKSVGKPIEVTENEDITVSTGFGTGVSAVNMKTVYYSMKGNNDNCHFDLTIEVQPPKPQSRDPVESLPRLVACAKNKSPEAVFMIMEIHLPTGVIPLQQDLDLMQNGLERIFNNFEIRENQVILQHESVPSDSDFCVIFRIHELFRTGMLSGSLFKVYDFRNPDSQCSKLYYPTSESKLLRLCEGEQCQCMMAECCNFKAEIDASITLNKRMKDACQENIKYAFKVKIKSTVQNGDFVSYVATVEAILIKGKEDIKINAEVELVKKASCTSVEIMDEKMYLIMGVETMDILVNNQKKYKFLLDSQAWVEYWPASSDCRGTCTRYLEVLEEFSDTILIDGC